MLKNIRSNAMNREMLGFLFEEKLTPITRGDILEYPSIKDFAPIPRLHFYIFLWKNKESVISD